MILRQLNATPDRQHGLGPIHDANIIISLDTLNAIWAGQFDTNGTVTELRRTAERLTLLADAIENAAKTPQ